MKNNYNYLFFYLGKQVPEHFIQKRNMDTNKHFIQIQPQKEIRKS